MCDKDRSKKRDGEGIRFGDLEAGQRKNPADPCNSAFMEYICPHDILHIAKAFKPGFVVACPQRPDEGVSRTAQKDLPHRELGQDNNSEEFRMPPLPVVLLEFPEVRPNWKESREEIINLVENFTDETRIK